MGPLCVDNLPPMMLVPFMEACQNARLHNPMIAIAADVRSGEFFDAKAVTKMIDEARLVGFHIDTLFIEASDEVLVNRYKETRRDHPLSGEGLTLHEAIREERNRLMPLRETANHLIDTSNLRPRALQKMLKEIVLNAGSEPPLRVEVLSFGFKRGIPREGDLVLTCAFAQPVLYSGAGVPYGAGSGCEGFVLEHPVTKEFLVKCMDMLQFLLPHYITEGKHRLVIAIGCTGGAHRSVAIAEYISARLEELGYHTTVNHRDIALEQAHWETKSEYQKGEP